MRDQERQALQMKRISEFDRTTYDVNIKCGESKTFVFQYKEDPEYIEGYKIFCKTCTTVKKEGGNFELTFTAPPRSDYAVKIKNGETFEKYNSNVSVYFKDGEPLQTFNSNGELKDNPDKVCVNLTIRTTIELV